MPKKPYRVTTDVPPIPDIDNNTEEGLLNLFDQDNPDINLFNLIDDENIRLAGSRVYVYKYLRSTDYDTVYMEERNKAIANEPVVLWGHYDPKPVEENLNEFGIELTNDQTFIFNKAYVERILGRGLIPGDVIKQAFQEQKYEVYEVQEDEFHGYGVYHLNCFAKLLREHEDIQDTPMTDGGHDDPAGYAGEEDEW